MSKYLHLVFLGLCILIFTLFARAISAQVCDQTMKYSCLDASGNLIGTVEVPAIQSGISCMPGLGNTLTEACRQIAGICNTTHPALCQGHCTAGDAQQKNGQSCRGFPVPPSNPQQPSPDKLMPNTPRSSPF